MQTCNFLSISHISLLLVVADLWNTNNIRTLVLIYTNQLNQSIVGGFLFVYLFVI